MPRYKLTIEYDGSCFSGWQRQSKHTSVQETIEIAIKEMLKEEAPIVGAGRTDAGVHALGQVAHVDLSRDIPGFKLCDGLNNFLRDKGVAILTAEIVPSEFHARFSATARSYEYRIINRRPPLVLDTNHAWHVIPSLDVASMQRAAKHLIGQHDFTSFRASHCQAASPIRTVERFEISENASTWGNLITATVQSRSFLHNQVRIMMGTLKLVGEGIIHAEDIPQLIEARDRCQTGPTAPPQGLYLKSIAY
jgi:tRNA pseudouridine38-40 synthase